MERTDGDDIVPLTHEQLATLLGVGRSYTSRVIQIFKAEGMLETRRGSILVRNPDALRIRSCLCNEAVKNHFEEVLRGVYPTEERQELQPDAESDALRSESVSYTRGSPHPLARAGRGSNIARRQNHATLAAMSGAMLHAIFDVAAWCAAGIAIWWLSRVRGLQFPSQSFELSYIAALVFGAGLGAYLFGTLNLWLSGLPGIARSVEGALAGGIFAIELYKWRAGISLRTGARFALPLAVGIAVGRLGCYFAGLDDFTYGTPTTLPWGHDFGDGILRHPVQLYESLAMAAFAVFYVRGGVEPKRVSSSPMASISRSFYYGLQRFIWEFLKPYGALIGPLSLFHLLSLAVLIYAVVMLATAPTVRLKHERAAA